MRTRIVSYLGVIIALSAMTENAYAVAQGLYLGLMAGPATNNGSTQNVEILNPPPPPPIATTPASPRSNQFGTRVYLGYKFNTYMSFEGGFAYFSGINYDTKGVPTCSSTSVRVRDIDLMAKGEYNFASALGIFAKAGVAERYMTTSGAFSPTYTTLPGQTTLTTCGKSKYTTKAAPIFGGGVSYDFNQNWVMDVTWTRLMTGGIINSMDSYALGLSYHFVDKYCGQFLCED